MDYEPSCRSASVAGVWFALGIVPFELWIDHHQSASGLINNLLWLIASVVFLVAPSYFLVIGQNTGPFSRTWFLDSEQRAEYAAIVRRMFCWFLAAAIFGSLWSYGLTYFLTSR